MIKLSRDIRNETKLDKKTGGSSKATRAENNLIIFITLHDRRLTVPIIIAQRNQCYEKNLSTCTVRKLCEAGLSCRITVKKPLLRNQNNVNQCSKSFGSIELVIGP